MLPTWSMRQCGATIGRTHTPDWPPVRTGVPRISPAVVPPQTRGCASGGRRTSLPGPGWEEGESPEAESRSQIIVVSRFRNCCKYAISSQHEDAGIIYSLSVDGNSSRCRNHSFSQCRRELIKLQLVNIPDIACKISC